MHAVGARRITERETEFASGKIAALVDELIEAPPLFDCRRGIEAVLPPPD